MTARWPRCRSPSTGSLLAVCSLLASVLCASAADRPRFERRPGAVVVISMPPILDREDVRAQLESGLTTTFIVKILARDGRGNRALGEGWIALRYELWDEVFLAATGGLFGTRRFRLDSLDALAEWWASPAAANLDTTSLTASDRWRVRLDLEVVPFSRGEQQDAQRWMAKTLSDPDPGSADTAGSGDGSADAFGGVLRLLLATSIRPDPLLRIRENILLSPLPASPELP